MANIKSKITKRERDVLEELWNSERPLLASDITKLNSALSISSVQLSLRNLLEKEIIEVADIVQSGTVLSRSYRPIVSREELFLQGDIGLDKAISTQNIVATLLKREKNEAEVIQELEQMLEERKQQLKKKSSKKK